MRERQGSLQVLDIPIVLRVRPCLPLRIIFEGGAVTQVFLYLLAPLFCQESGLVTRRVWGVHSIQWIG